MATTTNYGWDTPDDTDLVKDGASAIRTLGSSIDTTTKNLNPETTTGALAYRSATSNVNTALTIGTNGQLLRVNSGATAPEWALGVNLQLNAQTATYTVVLGDAFKLVTMSVATANDFQIPTNASVAFPVGTVINVIQIGAGQTTIKAVTSGTTTISSTGASATAPKLRAQFSAASCIKVATDTWYVVGDIA
jgi:hypothetical protein